MNTRTRWLAALVAASAGLVCPQAAHGRALGIPDNAIEDEQIIDDVLDFDEFEDALDLDAATTITGAGTSTLAITTDNWSITAGGVFVIAGLTIVGATPLRLEGVTNNGIESLVAVGDPTVADSTFTIPNMAGVNVSFMLSTLTTNAPEAANSVWGASAALIFEGVTPNAFETTLTAPDVTADQTGNVPDVGVPAGSGDPNWSFLVTLLDGGTGDPHDANSVWSAGNNFTFEGVTADAFETTVAAPDPVLDVTYQIPDSTVAVVGGGIADADVSLVLSTLGVGLNDPGDADSVWLGPSSIVFEGLTGGAGDAFELTLAAADPTVGDATITIPNVAGVADTLALLTLAQTFVGAKTFTAETTFNGGITATDAGADTIALGAAADTVTIVGDVAITDPQWSVTAAGAPTFAGLISGTSGATISGAVLTANAGLTVVGTSSLTGVVNQQNAAVNSDTIQISGVAAGAAPFTGTITNADLTVARTWTLPNWSGTLPIPTTVGTTTTVLHGDAAGQPVYGAVALAADVSGILPVANGGTALAGGTSGGVLGYTAAGTLASSVALTASALVLGGGVGATPTPLGSLGTTTTLLHGNAAGAPTFGAVVAADITDITRSDPIPLDAWDYCGTADRAGGAGLNFADTADAFPDLTRGSAGTTAGSLALEWDTGDTEKVCVNIPIPTDYVSGSTVRLYFLDTATNDHTHDADTLLQATGSVEDTTLSPGAGTITPTNGPSGQSAVTACDSSGSAAAIYACDFATEAVAAGNILVFSYARAAGTEATTMFGAEFRYTATQ